MPELLVFGAVAVVVGIAAVRFGMLIAPRLDRLIDRADADDPGARDA